MLRGIRLTWTSPTPSSSCQFSSIENKSIEMIRNVKIVFSELPPKHIHETISEEKRAILLSSLANLEKSLAES